MSKKRELTDKEKKLLAVAMQDVTPLPGIKKLVTGTPAEPRPKISQEKAAALPPQAAKPTQAIDKTTAKKLMGGEYKIEAKLDLHGMTLEQAHTRLEQFVEACHQANKRAVLVITGKGGKDGKKGKLQHEVPRWLAYSGLSRMILMISSARPKHGGEGALYLLLKRKK